MLVVLSEAGKELEGKELEETVGEWLWGGGRWVTKELKTNNYDFCRRRKDAVTTAPVTTRYKAGLIDFSHKKGMDKNNSFFFFKFDLYNGKYQCHKAASCT